MMKSGLVCQPGVWVSVSADSTLSGRICLVPQVEGVGGMVSFQHKLLAGLQKRGIQTARDLSDLPYDAVLVIGGTRDSPAPGAQGGFTSR